MSRELQSATDNAHKNIDAISQKIKALKVSGKFKGAFMKMVDIRGFRDTPETYKEMQVIGDTKSDTCISLLEGKGAGLIVAYHLATQLDNEKARAMVLQELNEHNLKFTENNVLKAILTVKNRFDS